MSYFLSEKIRISSVVITVSSKQRAALLFQLSGVTSSSVWEYDVSDVFYFDTLNSQHPDS